MARKLLDQRVSLRRAPEGVDDYGQSVAVPSDAQEWPEIAALWASYMPVSDGEKARSNQVSGVAVGWFTVHAGVGVRLTDVLIFNGEVWQIGGAKPQGRKFVEITATRKGAAV